MVAPTPPLNCHLAGVRETSSTQGGFIAETEIFPYTVHEGLKILRTSVQARFQTKTMLAKTIDRLRNGYMVYHFGVSFKEVRFCTKVLDILWKENLIKGYTKTNEEFINFK